MASPSTNEIRILDYADSIRRRAGMYIGPLHDPEAMHQLVFGLVDRALDHHVAGAGNRIVITLDEEGSATVEDEGQGIQFALAHGQLALPHHSLATALSLFAPPPRRQSPVDLAIISALTSSMTLDSFRDGTLRRLETSRGHIVAGPTRIDATGRTGTRVTITPDRAIFPSPTSFDPLRVANRLTTFATFHPRVRFELRHPGHCTTITCPSGLTNLVERLPHEGPLLLPFVASWSFTFNPGWHDHYGQWHADEHAPLARASIALRFAEGAGALVGHAEEHDTWRGGSHVIALRGGIIRTLRATGRLDEPEMTAALGRVNGAIAITSRECQFRDAYSKLHMPSAIAPLVSGVSRRLTALLSEYPSLRPKLLPPPP